MKKILFALAFVLGIGVAAQARDNYERTDASLPEAAKMTISKNFKAKVSLVKIEKKFGSIHEYEVILTDGTEIQFDAKGNWEDVETPANKSVPSSLIPKGITDYVSKNYKKNKIVGIEKKSHGYEVELSNGIDMVFDRTGNFQRFD